MPSPHATLPEAPDALARLLVAQLGPHPSTQLSLSLAPDDDSALGRWLIAAILFAHRATAPRARDAYRALEADALVDPGAILPAGPAVVETILLRAGIARADAPALVIQRACVALEAGYGGRLSKLAGQSEGIEDLGARLSQLASGFGRAGVTLFLQPLRELWTAADDLPLEATAAAAAVHLGWLGDSEEASAARLRALLQLGESDPPFHDVEAALGSLGRTACRRNAITRCALGSACPAAGAPGG